MAREVKRIAMVSMHTSPAAQPGQADAGGMNVSVLSSALELARLGVEVDLLTRATGSPAVTGLAPGVTLHEFSAGPEGDIPKGRLSEVSGEFGEAVAALAGRDSSRYDVIHAHYWLSGIATLPVAIELGLPFVQSFHTLGAMKNRRLADGDSPEPQLRLRSEMYLAHQADAVVAGSSAEVSCLIDQVGAPPGRLWVVPPGVDTALFTPARAAADTLVRLTLGIEPGRPILAVVGRIQPLKDQALAIRALAAVPASPLSHARPVLVIAGEPTPGTEGYLATLLALAEQLGVAADVRFPGSLGRDDLANLLATASLTLVPSHSETFGLVALESAASGTPVIAARSTGLVDSVAEGESGVLLDSRDPAEWGRVCSLLLRDTALLGEFSASARRHAEGFSWAATAAGLLGVYGRLTAVST